MTSNGHPIRRYALRWYNRLFTLKAQLTFILLGVSLLSGILCASLLSRSGSNILKKNAIAQNCMQMNQLAYNMNEQLKELEQCAYSLALNDSLQEVVSYRRIDNYSSQNAFSKSLVALDELAMRNTLAEALFVYMEDGLIIGRNAESNLFIREGINDRQIAGRVSYNSEIMAKTENSIFTLVFLGHAWKNEFYYLTPLSQSEDYPILVFGYRFRFADSNDKEERIIAMIVRESELRSLYDKQDGEMAVRYLIDENGTIVSHANSALHGTKAALFQEEWLEGDGVFTAKMENGKTSYITCSQLGNLGLYLISETAQDAILKDLMFLKYQMALCIVLATLILPPISILLIQRVMRPMQKLSDSMQQMEKGNLNQCVTEIPHNELGVLIRQYNRMAQSIQQLTWQNNQIADEKRLTEVQALQAYINPHFLYNTILTLRWMAIMVQANNLADAMTAFDSMLKPLYDTNEAMWTLAEERAFLENYIRIMNYRYGNGVQISIDLPAELSEYKILKFIVQPLVENAFSYGIHTDTCTGQIDICFEKDEDALRIQVTDHGEGMSNERLSQLRNALKEEVRQYGSHGMALPNMARRLRLYYGTGSHLTVDSDKQGTCVKMVLPFSSDEVSKG